MSDECKKSDNDAAPVDPVDPVLPAPPVCTPSEPYLVVRGSDPAAFMLTSLWTDIHRRLGNLTSEQAIAMDLHAWMLHQCAVAAGQDVSAALQAWFDMIRSVQPPSVERLPEGERVH